MKIVAEIISLPNTVVKTHYLFSFWRFLWPFVKSNLQLNSHWATVTFAVLVLLLNAFFLYFFHKWIFTWGRWIRIPSTGLFNCCQQSKELSLSYFSYNISENWKQWKIIFNIYVLFINYNRVIWETMVSSVHNTLYRLPM